MYTNIESKKWIFHFTEDILRDGIEEEEYNRIADFIEEKRKLYGKLNIYCKKNPKTKKYDKLIVETRKLELRE